MAMIHFNSAIHQIKFSHDARHSPIGMSSGAPLGAKDCLEFRHIRNSRRSGFTVIELLFVMAIIGVLAAIAIPFLRDYMKKGYDGSAKSDLKNVYTTAQIYFSDHPDGEVDPPSLSEYGYRVSDNVNITIVDGTMNGFSLEAAHSSGSKTYTIDSDGVISSN